MGRSLGMIGVALACAVGALGCGKSGADASEGESVAMREDRDTEGSDRERSRRGEPAGAAPEERGAPMPGQEAEQASSPGALSRSGRSEVDEGSPEAARGDALEAPTAEARAEEGEPSRVPMAEGQGEAEAAGPAREAGGEAQAAGSAREAERDRELARGVSEQTRHLAIAELENESKEGVEGTLVLSEDERGVFVEANVAGLEPGTHEVVISDTPSCDELATTASRATQAGEARAARAPERERSAEPPPEREGAIASAERELGRIEVGRDGAVRYRLLTNQLSLSEEGADTVIGKTFVIKPEGAEGEEARRSAVCGVIESAG